MITSDGKTLIMAIETDFTQGGTDLYFTTLKEDGSYGLLQNMGKSINSAADEGMCQLFSDTKTLLFSSNGFSTYGDYDIFIIYRLDESWKNWSEPINLGSKINSNDFDGSPFYDEHSEQLYFISIHEGNQVIKTINLPKNVLKQE
jgi:Tol biopolymer transport system component